MKKRRVMTVVVAGMLVALGAGEVPAAGRGGAGAGKQGGAGGVSTATRPAGSQRRDGTFLNTGTTANGATTRPSSGNGVQDGSHLTATPTPTATSTSAGTQ